MKTTLALCIPYVLLAMAATLVSSDDQDGSFLVCLIFLHFVAPFFGTVTHT